MVAPVVPPALVRLAALPAVRGLAEPASSVRLTIINDGTITGGLSGDGTTRADAIVFTGGTNFLGGTGTVGSFTMTSGGTFAPGSGAPGTKMTVSGNLAFQSGGVFYLVQLSPATSSLAEVTDTANTRRRDRQRAVLVRQLCIEA